MLNRLYTILTLLTAALVLGSCVKDDRDPDPESTRVLLAYIGVDNNLTGKELLKLYALRDGWTGNTGDRIIAYVDKLGMGATLYELSVGKGSEPFVLETYGAENSASAATLSRVISNVRGLYPADSYGLLVFSHASGWLPESIYNEFAAGRIPQNAVMYSGERAASRSLIIDGRYGDTGLAGNESRTRTPQGADTRSVIIDGSDEMGASRHTESAENSLQDRPKSRSVIVDGDNEMCLQDFAAAIPEGVFDYIVFEACFMSGIEVAYELRGKAPYILASSAEIIDPGFAPVYGKSASKILAANLPGFGQDVFDYTLATYSTQSPRRSATYSVIRTGGLDALAAFVKANCDFSREVDIDEVQRFDRLSAATLFFDFEDYYGRLLATDSQRAELSRLVADCVRWKAATEGFMTPDPSDNGFVIGKHSGLTTYIPQKGFEGLNEAYYGLGWVGAVSSAVGVNPWLARMQGETPESN